MPRHYEKHKDVVSKGLTCGSRFGGCIIIICTCIGLGELNLFTFTVLPIALVGAPSVLW